MEKMCSIVYNLINMKGDLMKKVLRIIIAIIIIAFISPYIFVELNTLIWKREFKNEYKQTNMIGKIKYYKVFYKFGDKAKVYYVDGTTGNFVYLEKQKDSWKMKEWKTVWSENGSADGITFPYYPHF